MFVSLPEDRASEVRKFLRLGDFQMHMDEMCGGGWVNTNPRCDQRCYMDDLVEETPATIRAKALAIVGEREGAKG